MIAEQQRIYTPGERLQLARETALHQVMVLTAGRHELSRRVEQLISETTLDRIAPILAAADALVLAGVELAAIDRRLDNHVQMHAECQPERPCWGYRVLQIRRKRHQRTWDRAYRRLAGGVW